MHRPMPPAIRMARMTASSFFIIISTAAAKITLTKADLTISEFFRAKSSLFMLSSLSIMVSSVEISLML